MKQIKLVKKQHEAAVNKILKLLGGTTIVKHNTKATVAQQQKQKALLAGVGRVFRRKGEFPSFINLTGKMLRKLVDAGVVPINMNEPEGNHFGQVALTYDVGNVFHTDDRDTLLFLESNPKLVAQGLIGNLGVGTMTIDTIVSRKPLARSEARKFLEQFHGADELWTSSTKHDGVYARAWFD